MTADAPADFSYEVVPEEGRPDVLRTYWGIAQGLQAVDGLETSDKLKQLSQDNIEGVRGLGDTGELLRFYYDELAQSSSEFMGEHVRDATKEADFVAFRIAELLSRRAFLFSPVMLSRIHAHIFQDLGEEIYRPGMYKEQALQKQESILNGDSVVYADPTLIDASLKAAFEDELDFPYGSSLDGEALAHFTKFISRLWQVHPFAEGNTRTVAVFSVLYLNDLGYDVTNEPFESNARYFRNALVRANYRNPKAEVFPDRSFLERFFGHVLAGSVEPLHSRDLMVEPLFADPSLLRNVPAGKALTMQKKTE